MKSTLVAFVVALFTVSAFAVEGQVTHMVPANGSKTEKVMVKKAKKGKKKAGKKAKKSKKSKAATEAPAAEAAPATPVTGQ